MHARIRPIALQSLSLLLTACGGLSAEAPAPSPAPSAALGPAPDAPPPPAPGPAVLTASTPSLSLTASGRARHFTVTNTGGQPAQGITVTGAEALPAGSALSTDCATLAPGAQCTVTLTPGAQASAPPMDIQAQPVNLGIAGSSTNTLSLSVHVLDFGSVFQGGYVFHLDDTTPDTQGVGGKVMSLTLRQNPWSEAFVFGAPPRPDFWDVIEGARSLTDGEANTRAIVAHMNAQQPPLALQAYQAGACSESNEGGHQGWYLPAICELSYDDSGWNNFCGTRSQPLVPDNMRSRLADTGLLRHGGLLSGGAVDLTSSTEDKDSIEQNPTGAGNLALSFSLLSTPNPGVDLVQIAREGKDYPSRYRCVRQLTP